MRMSLGVGLVMLAVGCAHAPGKPPATAANAEALSDQASTSYEALDFPACAEQFRAAAEACGDAPCRASSFYRAAGCASLAGEASQALELLKRSAQAGYADAEHLRLNPELTALHAWPGWREVVTHVEANLQKAPESLNREMGAMAKLGGIDVYGSRRVDAETVGALLGAETGKPIVYSKAFFRLKERELREKYSLALAQVSFVFFFAGDDEGSAFLTVDLVDAEDAHRLRFLPEPKGHPEDPEGLVSRWMEYDRKSEQLMRSGALELGEEGPVCRVAHCIFGFAHPELAPFEPVFLEKVPKSVDALTRVLREEADAEKRAAAAYLLAYAATPEGIVERLVPSIRDPDSGVRNGVLRVLTATQEKAERPLVDVAVVVDALSLPGTLDRNKGLYLLEMLLKDLKPEALAAQREPLIRQLGAQLVAMTSLIQPINREPAVLVLELLSGKKHESPEQWKAWLAQQGGR